MYFFTDGLLIPKDCNILVPIFYLHKDPKYWERPEEFYPEHFLPEKVKQRPEFVYMPFSAGTRSCIGIYCIAIISAVVYHFIS